jgi:hypothetical protein
MPSVIFGNSTLTLVVGKYHRSDCVVFISSFLIIKTYLEGAKGGSTKKEKTIVMVMYLNSHSLVYELNLNA